MRGWWGGMWTSMQCGTSQMFPGPPITCSSLGCRWVLICFPSNTTCVPRSADAAAANQVGVLLQRPAGETCWLMEKGTCSVTTPVALQVAHIDWYQFISGETRRKQSGGIVG